MVGAGKFLSLLPNDRNWYCHRLSWALVEWFWHCWGIMIWAAINLTIQLWDRSNYRFSLVVLHSRKTISRLTRPSHCFLRRNLVWFFQWIFWGEAEVQKTVPGSKVITLVIFKFEIFSGCEPDLRSSGWRPCDDPLLSLKKLWHFQPKHQLFGARKSWLINSWIYSLRTKPDWKNKMIPLPNPKCNIECSCEVKQETNQKILICTKQCRIVRRIDRFFQLVPYRRSLSALLPTTINESTHFYKHLNW